MLHGLSDVQISKLAANTLLPMDVRGDKQYLLSLRHGVMLDRERLVALLKGELRV